MRRSVWKKYVAFLLAAALIAGTFEGAAKIEVRAAGTKVLTLDMAKKNGLTNSSEYDKLQAKLYTKQVSFAQAVKSIALKKKNLASFRWTPLLSFKFPEKPDLAEAYEFQFKPVQIQAEIDTIKHQMTDQKLAVYEKVSNLYVDIVALEKTISFDEARNKTLQETLAQNRLKLTLGQATKSDIDAMEKAVRALDSKIAGNKRSLEASKKKLSTAIGMDVTTGYTFVNPFVDANIRRSQLKELTQYTLDRDQTYYETAMNATTSLLSLRTNYSLMSGQYGQTMNYISGYVNQALTGRKINTTAFRKSYDAFLTAVDAPWQGSIKILFISIPKEWFKGKISGIRYVEDEPYALYEAALEYQDALLEKNNAKQTVTQQVEDSFNNLVNIRNSYTALVADAKIAEEELKKEAILNRLGELTYDEYKSSLDDYETLQNDMLSSLAAYSQTLYSFDRLTCGGVTELLKKTGASLGMGAGGESYIKAEYADGASYYIEPIIQEQEFRLGVNIPENFAVKVTHFELWCDQIKIGSRTGIDSSIRHLSLAVDNVSEVKLRFYNNGKFVDDCVIDPDVYSGPLDIVQSYGREQTPDLEVGTYTSQFNQATGMFNIALKTNAKEDIGYYLIKNADGLALIGDELIPIGKEFQYLSLVQGSLNELVIEFYGGDSKLKYKGHFDTLNMKLIRD